MFNIIIINNMLAGIIGCCFGNSIEKVVISDENALNHSKYNDSKSDNQIENCVKVKKYKNDNFEEMNNACICKDQLPIKFIDINIEEKYQINLDAHEVEEPYFMSRSISSKPAFNSGLEIVPNEKESITNKNVIKLPKYKGKNIGACPQIYSLVS